MALLLVVVFLLLVIAYLLCRSRPVDITASYIEQAAQILNCIEQADSCDSVAECLDEVEVDETIRECKKLRSKALYSKYVVNCAKNKFGSLVRNQANMAIVRKFVLDEMVEHGVIARHISKTIDAIVETVFVHSERELVALAIRHTKKAKERAKVARALAGPPEAT